MRIPKNRFATTISYELLRQVPEYSLLYSATDISIDCFLDYFACYTNDLSLAFLKHSCKVIKANVNSGAYNRAAIYETNSGGYQFMVHRGCKYESRWKYIRANPGIQISVTKVPPHKWTDSMAEADKWLDGMNDVFLHARGTPTQRYVKGTSDIVISGAGVGGLPFKLVERVVIEEHPGNPSFFAQVSSAFNNCLAAHKKTMSLTKRNCRNPKCKCKDWSDVVKHENVYKYDFGKWAAEFKSA